MYRARIGLLGANEEDEEQNVGERGTSKSLKEEYDVESGEENGMSESLSGSGLSRRMSGQPLRLYLRGSSGVWTMKRGEAR